ncbi:MAG: cation transporter [Verrucomicrobiales bacterium]|nr:cation transporter [Verrucomicrobiales bacterium]
MKNIFFATALLAASALVAHAETTVVVNGVHNCCKSCANAITKAVGSVKGASATADGDTVTITAKNESGAKKALAALQDAGFSGEIEGSEPATASDKVLKGATVEGVHLCCGKCVKAMTAAVTSVPGVTAAQIENKATSFTVEGEFKEGDLIAAMNKAGFHGKVK